MMPKSGVEAYIYLDFYSDEIYTEDEINKITGVDCSKATFESPLIVKPNQINGVSFTVATEDAENIRHRVFPILSEIYNADKVEFEPCNEMEVMIDVFRSVGIADAFIVRKRMPYYLQFVVSEDTEMAKRIFHSTMYKATKSMRHLGFAFTENVANILVTPLDGRM
jgi:hypothetical protein